MTEVRRVRYSLNGTEHPVVHLECRKIDNEIEVKRVGTCVERTNSAWQAKAFTELRNWLKVSSDKQKTVETWAATYLSCGACYRGFTAWAARCKAETLGWLPLAIEAIKKNRWI